MMNINFRQPVWSKEAWQTIREAMQDWNKTARLVSILATILVAPPVLAVVVVVLVIP